MSGIELPEPKRSAPRKHLIAEVRFQQAADQHRPMSEASLLCTCGEVTTSGDWERHRGDTVDMERVRRNHAAWLERQEEA